MAAPVLLARHDNTYLNEEKLYSIVPDASGTERFRVSQGAEIYESVFDHVGAASAANEFQTRVLLINGLLQADARSPLARG